MHEINYVIKVPKGLVGLSISEELKYLKSTTESGKITPILTNLQGRIAKLFLTKHSTTQHSDVLVNSINHICKLKLE